MSEKLGVDKIEALLESAKELIVLGKKVKEDGKIDVTDLAHVIALLPKIPVFIENFKAIGEAVDEGKELEVAELVELIQKVHKLIKEIEAA